MKRPEVAMIVALALVFAGAGAAGADQARSRGASPQSSGSAPRSGGSASTPRVAAPRSGGGQRSAPSRVVISRGTQRGANVSDTRDTVRALPSRQAVSRPRDGRPVTGQAVARTGYHVRPPYYPGYYHHYYPGYYPGWYWNSAYWYPYGFGAWGLGWYAYDPWGGWGFPGPYYGGSYAYSYADETGDVRLMLKPRDAQVYVDGGYVGIVDEFDGTFQRLRLDTGPHKIEVRKEGLESLVFDVNVTPDHTITLRGELRPAVG